MTMTNAYCFSIKSIIHVSSLPGMNCEFFIVILRLGKFEITFRYNWVKWGPNVTLGYNRGVLDPAHNIRTHNKNK